MASYWDVLVPTAAKNKTRNPSAEASEIVGPELLSNTGFETAGGGGADVFGSWTESAGDGSIVDSATAHTGTHAANLNAGASANTYIYQAITTTPGKMYTTSFWTQGDGANAGRYQIWDNTNGAAIISLATTGVTAAAYAYREVSYVAPAACVSVLVTLYCPALNTAGCLFDDVNTKETNAGIVHLGTVSAFILATTAAKYGVYMYFVSTTADDEGVMFALDALDNTAHYVTMWTFPTLPASWDWSLDDSTYTAPTLLDTEGGWSLYGATFNAAQSNGSTALRVRQNGAGSTSFLLDAIQTEEGTGATTYIDGDQAGCEWDGEAHNSTSSRSVASREGGEWKNLYDDYGLIVTGYIGAGKAPRSTSSDGYSKAPGGKLNNSIRTQRPWSLVAFINSTTYSDLLTKRGALNRLFEPEAKPETEEGLQPVRLRHRGGDVNKWIEGTYETGLEIDHSWRLPVNERVAIRFLSDDPNFYEEGDSTAVLDTNDTATLRHVAGRLKSTGQWDDLGITAAPSADGEISAICVARDKSVYYGGDFDDFDGAAGRDNIARYTPSTDTWSTVVGAGDVSSDVQVISEGPDGKIYIGGQFQNVDTIAAADFVAVYDPEADTWAAVGVPNTGTASITRVTAMAWDSEGNLYVGGLFTNFADVANADYFAKWNGTAWSAVGSGGTGSVSAIAIDADDNIYIGGLFTNWAADGNADYWAWWNGTAWAAVDDIALNGNVYALKFDDVGDLYVGGAFTDADSNANADYIFKWTGVAVEALGVGTNNTVFSLMITPEGSLWAGGQFDTAGSISSVDRIAIWNGSSWTNPDINLPSAPPVYALGSGSAGKTIATNFDVYIGMGITGLGSGYFSGTTTVTNAGTAKAYPKIVVKRSGGTSARLVQVRSETLGVTLSFDYSLLDGETLTIDLHPDRQTIESSFFGSRPDALLAGSDLSKFHLLTGDNQITAFVDVAGAPTVTAYMLWKDAFDGIDDYASI